MRETNNYCKQSSKIEQFDNLASGIDGVCMVKNSSEPIVLYEKNGRIYSVKNQNAQTKRILEKGG